MIMSPQTYWPLSINNVNLCDTAMTSPSDELIIYSAMPLPHLAFKNTSLNRSGSLSFGGTSHSLSLHCPATYLSLLQTPKFGFVWPPCWPGAHELVFENTFRKGPTVYYTDQLSNHFLLPRSCQMPFNFSAAFTTNC